MGFRRNVHYCIDLVDQTVHELRVADVSFDEGVAFVVFYFMQVSWVSAYAHFVNVYQFTVRVLCKHKPAEVASDKS